MVNFSNKANTPLNKIAKSSKKIHKKTASPHPSLNSIEDAKTCFSTPLSQKNNSPTQNLEVDKRDVYSIYMNILQPFCNLLVCPSGVRKILENIEKSSLSELSSSVFALKTPNNNFSFSKKIEKMKLLSLSQETIIQSFLKETFNHNQKPEVLQEYYKFMKAKLSLDKENEERERDSRCFNDSLQEAILNESKNEEENSFVWNYGEEKNANFDKGSFFEDDYQW